jgi:phospholipid transport system substrate-binding protein
MRRVALAVIPLWLPMALLVGPSLRADAAVAAEEAEARQFVQETIDDVMKILHDSQLELDQKKNRVEQIAYDRFEFELISRFVLARNWNTMNEQQRADFIDAFKKHLSVTYRDALDSFRDEKITITSSRLEPRGDVTVMTLVHQNSGDTKVDYRLRKTDAGWRGIDIIIEGVSLVQNFRSQAQEIISAEGADALIQKLRNKQIDLEAGIEKS